MIQKVRAKLHLLKDSPCNMKPVWEVQSSLLMPIAMTSMNQLPAMWPPAPGLPQADKQTDDLDGPIELSGGQWQHLALSKAVMRVVALSSSFDAEAEHKFFQFIEQVRSNAAMICPTDRLHTVRGATKIAFLNEGRLNRVDMIN